MASDGRALLDVLRAELDFIQKGGYRNPAKANWRPQFIFQDSPSCVNFDPAPPRKPCADCILMRLVPESEQARGVPCRYIPLNEQGETIDSYYRTGTQEELEAAVVQWLKTTIERLERESQALPSGKTDVPARPEASGLRESGSSPVAGILSTCANPDCAAAFRCGQGRFFRFHKNHGVGEAPNTHSVQHFWLCGECCMEFTLDYQNDAGVLIKNRPDVTCAREVLRFIAAA